MHIPIDLCPFRQLRVDVRKEMSGDEWGDYGVDEGVDGE